MNMRVTTIAAELNEDIGHERGQTQIAAIMRNDTTP